MTTYGYRFNPGQSTVEFNTFYVIGEAAVKVGVPRLFRGSDIAAGVMTKFTVSQMIVGCGPKQQFGDRRR